MDAEDVEAAAAPPANGEKSAPKPKQAAELGESLLPMTRVQRIMKADKELPNVTKEAVHTISVATVRTFL